MQDSLTIGHTTLGAGERSRLLDLNERLGHYFRSVFTVRWVIGCAVNMHTVSLQVHARSGYYHARTQGNRVRECIDVVQHRQGRPLARFRTNVSGRSALSGDASEYRE